MSPECFCRCDHLLGEGPMWDEKSQSLFWVDILNQKLHNVCADGSAHREWFFPKGITSLSPAAGGGYIATSESGFMLLDASLRVTREIDPVVHQPGINRFNDAKVDATGRLWAGTMHREILEPNGTLHRLDRDFSWACVDSGYYVCNGPTFSLDGKILYQADSDLREIYGFDMDEAGALSNKQVFARLEGDEGYPDGMTTDAEGCLWVASYSGWRIMRFAPDGQRLEHVDLPAPLVTSCAFGGPDFTTLFITTASKGMTEEQLAEAPLSGSVFCLDTDVRGLPANSFGQILE